MKLLNTIRILSGALFISLCCLTASCNFLEIVPVEQADLMTQHKISTALWGSCILVMQEYNRL